MENYWQNFLGIAVSIVLFLIGYRQTIGAKKERIKTANSEIEKILIRRIVLEQYCPKLIDISRLIEGKARDSRVKMGDLFSESQIMNCVYTRIVETDLIMHDEREKILSRIIPVIEEAEGAPIEEHTVAEISSKGRKKSRYQSYISILMGVCASIVGALVTIIPKIGTIEMDFQTLLPLIVATTSVSFGIIISLYLFYRFKESQQEVNISSSSEAIERAIDFERNVAKTIQKLGLKISKPDSITKGYDFAIEKNNKKALVEVKAWTRPMPLSIVSKTIDMLENAIIQENANEGFLVVKSATIFTNFDPKNQKIQILNLTKLKNNLVRNYK